MAESATPPSAIKRKMDCGTMAEIAPWRPKKRISLRERESEREREREQSPRCETSSRQPQFENTSMSTWSLDKVKALVEFVL